MKGYVARDKNNSLWFHYVKPRKRLGNEQDYWISNDWEMELDPSCFPEFDDLVFEDEPVEVELTITKTNN